MIQTSNHDIKCERNLELEFWATSRASSEQMRLASLLLVYHLTDCGDTSSCSGVTHSAVSRKKQSDLLKPAGSNLL